MLLIPRNSFVLLKCYQAFCQVNEFLFVSGQTSTLINQEVDLVTLCIQRLSYEPSTTNSSKISAYRNCGILYGTFDGLPKISFAKTVSDNNNGIFVHADEGIHILTRRKVPITIKISKAKHGVDSISFCVEDQSPGSKMRIHKHLNNDELIFIHKGEGTLTLGEQSIQVKTGDVAFVPRGTWQGIANFKTYFYI